MIQVWKQFVLSVTIKHYSTIKLKCSGKSPNEEVLEEKIERLEKQYNSEAVDKKIQDMLTNERLVTIAMLGGFLCYFLAIP